MRAVLTNVSKKQARDIILGRDIIFLRKDRPELAPPFKVYIYISRSKKEKIRVLPKCRILQWIILKLHKLTNRLGYICDEVKTISTEYLNKYTGIKENYRDFYNVKAQELKQMGMNHEDLFKYGKGEPIYSLHIFEEMNLI